jgi:hypothetical protein
MSLPREGLHGLNIPLESATSRLSSLSIEDDYFGHSQIKAESDALPRPSTTDLPPSLALPLSPQSSTSNTPVPLRAGPSTSVDEDGASIRSFVPTLSAGDDLETMLSEMLGSDARWRMEEGDDVDFWEGQSEDDSDSDVDSIDEPEDDGTYRYWGIVNGR